MEPETPASRLNRARRFDPRRRDRIIDSALLVIAEVGVAGTTHRLIADKAGVPLGSMTYHFQSLDDVIWCALERFATGLQSSVDARVRNAAASGDIVQAVVSLVRYGTPPEHQHDTLLILELYILAIRQEKYRALVQRWMASTRAAFSQQFSTVHSEVIDALIEGFLIHRTFSAEVPTETEIRNAFCALAGSVPAKAQR